MNKFIHKKNNDLEYIQSGILLENKDTIHFFSSKNGGVSTGEFESLNLGMFTKDDNKNVQENFSIICLETSMNKNVAYLNQEHGMKVVVVTKDNYSNVVGSKGDAIITAQKNIPIGVFTADCVPILLYDKSKKVAAAIHAGWRGVEGKILTMTIEVMKNKFLSNGEDILCAIGPAIGPCCFEVLPDVANKFKFVNNRDSKLYVDLFKEVYAEAKECNILDENIDMLETCTVCESNLFHSYRRDGGKTGRIGSFIQII